MADTTNRIKTEHERLDNLNTKIGALGRNFGLVWDSKRGAWVKASTTAPPVTSPPVTQPPDDPPAAEPDPPVVVPSGDYWAQTAKARANGIGVNLGPFDPSDTTWPFSNLLSQADWRTPTWGYSDPPDVATKEVLLNFGQDMGTHKPPLPWTFNRANGIGPNNALPTVDYGGNIELRIGPGNLSKNAALMSSWEKIMGFHTIFLDRLAPVAGYIRFMDWQRTNNSTVRNWADINVDDSWWYTEHGIELAAMIRICNVIGAWPWFCIPHKATDAFVTSFCQYVKAYLDPRLTPIIELSNECWNHGMFQQARDFGTAGNYAARARQVMAIVKSILPGSHRIIGTQENNGGITDQVLAGDCSMFTHLACGWYCGYWMDESPLTPDDPVQILQNARSDIFSRVTNINQHFEDAQAKGLKLCGYEGGLHLVGVGGYVAMYYPRFRAANRHAMAGAVERELRAAVAPYFDYALQYTFCGRDSQWGMWGALEWIGADLSTQHRYNSLVADAQA